MTRESKVRLIASYLPQFYPIPENDLWWGKGFTEWTNVKKAQPLFSGHEQPRIPSTLGYYDLRDVEVRVRQAEMARAAGIEGFCYWHYWFGNGRRILERVFDEVVKSGTPDFPFCLGWANETWSGVWHGATNKILIEQLYPGKEDYTNHYNYLSVAFHDERYIKVDGKPVFLIYKPDQIPDWDQFRDLWQELAIKDGFPGIFFIAQTVNKEDIKRLLAQGYDAVNPVRLYEYEKVKHSRIRRGLNNLFNELRVFEYKDAMKYFTDEEDKLLNCIPTIIPNWDHSPRSGRRGYIIHHSTPELFREHVLDVWNNIQHKQDQYRISFIKSWNEWGESNYLEPDIRYGDAYLQVLKECFVK